MPPTTVRQPTHPQDVRSGTGAALYRIQVGSHWLNQQRELCAGALMLALGLFIAAYGYSHYRTGSLMHMGPGFLPIALGIILALLGVAIAVPNIRTILHSFGHSSAWLGAHAPPDHSAADAAEHEQPVVPAHPEWWAWMCILLGPILFITVGYWCGLAPGTFACVFVSALGDRSAKLWNSLILAIVVTGFGVMLFSDVLQVPLPAFPSRPVETICTFFAVGLLSYNLLRLGPLPASAVYGFAVLAACIGAGLLYFLTFGGVVHVLAFFIGGTAAAYILLQRMSMPALKAIIPSLFVGAILAFGEFELLNSIGWFYRFLRRGGL